MKNKFLAIFIIVLMMLSPAASAQGEPTIKISSVTAENEKTVAVKVFIENNPGMWGMDLRISYDKTKLTLVKAENGEVYSKEEWTEGNLKGEQYILSYARNDFQDTKNNGLLATLIFEINNPEVSGSYDITASYRSGDVINVNFGEIDFKIVNGRISVNSETEPLQTNTVTSAPQLNTFEAVLETEKPTETETSGLEQNVTETVTPTQESAEQPEATPVVDGEAVEAEANTLLLVNVGALVIAFFVYYLIKTKKDDE